jgi:hypothetical protein
MNTESYTTHSWAIVWLHGFVFSKMTCKLLLCACTGMKYSIFHLDLILLILAFAGVGAGIPEPYLFLPLGAWIVIDYFMFVSGVITEIAKHLGINVFRVKKID